MFLHLLVSFKDLVPDEMGPQSDEEVFDFEVGTETWNKLDKGKGKPDAYPPVENTQSGPSYREAGSGWRDMGTRTWRTCLPW